MGKDIKSLSKKDIFGAFIIITVFIILGTIALIYFGIKEDKISRETWKTIIGGPLALIGIWAYYFYQERIDKKDSNKKSLVQKTYETERKLTGGIGKFQSILILLVGIVFIIGGFLNFFGIGSSFEIPLKTRVILSTLIIAIGIGIIAVGIHFWKYSNIALQGRLYKKPEK